MLQIQIFLVKGLILAYTPKVQTKATTICRKGSHSPFVVKFFQTVEILCLISQVLESYSYFAIIDNYSYLDKFSSYKECVSKLVLSLVPLNLIQE